MRDKFDSICISVLVKKGHRLLELLVFLLQLERLNASSVPVVQNLVVGSQRLLLCRLLNFGYEG